MTVPVHRLTIVMPVYNAWPYLPETMDSLFRQTWKGFKLIVINDGSQDASGEYLRALQDDRVVLIENPENRGVVASFNHALELVNTEYVARMDADDICEPEKYQYQIDYMHRHPECVLLGTAAWHLSADGKRRGWPVQMPENHETIVAGMLQRRSAMINPTTVGRTKAIKEVGGYQRWPAEDYDLFLALGLKGRLANLPNRLYSIRLHDQSVTAGGLIRQQQEYERIRQKYYPLYREGISKSYGFFSKLIFKLDILSVYFYRRGLTTALNGSRWTGVVLLIGAAVLSPGRTVMYLRRKFFRQPVF